MGHDDRELWEVGGDVVNMRDRSRVLQLHSTSTGHADAGSGEPRVEQQRYAQLSAFLIQWIEPRVSREEGLVNRMQLEAPEPEIVNGAIQFIDCPTVFPRVHCREPNELLWVRVNELSYVVVGVRAVPCRGLSVYGKHDPKDVPFFVSNRQFLGDLRWIAEPEETPETFFDYHFRQSRLPWYMYVHIDCTHIE